ncbi:ATP-binding cassette domain-containing protein [Gordonia sp. HNM0687]|uniref:ATP-binding cassette domain-containing protein n=1 Tax=Gordonia mangrovi TaxID=2665643 RepID=A0A6L7GLN1_9ACTN|nr:ATP-binding cassette domain-containing protein [Gordonia mangrovi]MXP20780.1 ATP-binding cassette domain-containing protein [Gordonia mangrovi]UVF78653.1 ATP-binding cassette domain-containing protein [Gordonia mangrovi]
MITVENLTKRYGDHVAVNDVSFVCKPGLVTGFLGPNGAGKSTTMRIMVGLTPPTSGSVRIGDRPYREIPNPAAQVGVLLDASAQHAGRTGAEILRLTAMTLGVPSSRVDEMFDLVSLTPDEANRRVRNYSLGMRQRLGIANALIGDPHILILDEPANGLDPAGIHWMRSLLRDYANRGGTVLLSSHLLHEIEIIADEILVIGQGRIVAEGTKEELLAGSGTRVRSLDDDALAHAMSVAGIAAQPVTEGGFTADAAPEDIGRIALRQQIPLVELRVGDGAQLEEMFLQLTQQTQRESVPTFRDATALQGAQS